MLLITSVSNDMAEWVRCRLKIENACDFEGCDGRMLVDKDYPFLEEGDTVYMAKCDRKDLPELQIVRAGDIIEKDADKVSVGGKSTKRRKMAISAAKVAEWAGVTQTTVYAWDKNAPLGYPTRNGDAGVMMAWCREYKNMRVGQKKPGRKPGTGNEHLNGRHLNGGLIDLVVDPNGPGLPARKHR